MRKICVVRPKEMEAFFVFTIINLKITNCIQKSQKSDL